MKGIFQKGFLMFKYESVALYKFKIWISKDKLRLNYSYLSREIGVSHTAVNLWLSGETRPEHFFRIIIQILTENEVLVNDWLTAEEKENISGFELKKVG